MKKTAVFFLLALLVSADKLPANPRIRLSEASWDLGNVKEGKRFRKDLSIKNAGEDGLSLSARSSCECISVKPEKAEIKPGAETYLRILFDTKGESGKKTDYVFLDTNDPDFPHLSWVIEAYIESKPSKKAEGKSRINRHARPAEDEKTVELYIFTTPGCKYCQKLKEKTIPSMAEKNRCRIKVTEYSLSDKKNYEKLILWEKRYNSSGNRIPVIFVGKRILGGRRDIDRDLKEAVLSYTPGERVRILAGGAAGTAEKKHRSLGVLPILGAGLVDGFNPCAFAAIIFMISYMSIIIKKSRKEIFLTGISFSMGIFSAYFLLGLGLAKVLYAVKGVSLLTRVLYLFIGVITLLLALFSLKDFFSLKKEGGMFLRVPDNLRMMIYRVFEKHAKMRYFVLFSFFTGAVISVLELACTGQIYLPTILYMLQAAATRYAAVMYLLLYSFMFIIPLLVIFLVFFWGVHSRRIEDFGKSHYKTVKVINTVVFIFFSVYMFGVGLGIF